MEGRQDKVHDGRKDNRQGRAGWDDRLEGRKEGRQAFRLE
jgi:hypothetical protein